MCERGIVAAHLDLGEQRGDRARGAPLPEEVGKRLREHVAELPFGLGHADLERQRVGLTERRLDPHQHVPDLRPVAVPHDELDVGIEEGPERAERLVRERELSGHGEGRGGRREGIPSENDHHATATWHRAQHATSARPPPCVPW